ncbi:hypothetical protein DU002_10695 [Corallincola holothuriorum]|uniref:Histidine phosphatase family protein n=1 Tax=Corallincola holothuriorum TaxID=2282215 RepID=A0A368NIY8_9GAMM|nr:histidine phosphatase family protein [Corallincola holothuriorum]RCU49389.1 hypothetical protein DU002_10695 [Corallincola holothuriorum]
MSTLQELFLIRHGAVAGPPCLLGRTDTAVSDRGHQAAVELVEQMGDLMAYDALFTSPRIRCRRTADIIAKRCSLEVQTETGFSECDFGELDGKPFAAYSEDERQLLGKFWGAPMSDTLPGAEPLQVFHRRTAEALSSLWQRFDSQAIAFTHGGVIRMLLAEVMGFGCGGMQSLLSLSIPYASVTSIQRYHALGQDAQYSVRHLGWQPKFLMES